MDTNAWILMFSHATSSSQKVADGLVCAAVFFGVAVALAVYSGEWREFKDLIELVASLVNIDASLIIDFYNLNILIPSVGAPSVSLCPCSLSVSLSLSLSLSLPTPSPIN